MIAGVSGVSTAQSDLSVEVDTPDEVTEGESAQISASVSVPDVIGSHEAELTTTLYVDGEQIDSETLTIQDGETATASFSTTFDSSGSHEVTVEAAVTISGKSFSGETTRSIDVVEASDVSTPESDDTPSGTSGRQLNTIEVTGPGFGVPASLEDEVESYRQKTPKATPYAFVVAKEDELYLVFSEQKPTTGIAEVSGVDLPGSVSADGMEFKTVFARSVSFETEGESVSVQQISSSPESYSHELVQVEAHHRRFSVLSDTDQGEDPSVVSSAGVLVEEPITTSDLISEPGSRARSLLIDSSTNNEDVQVNNRVKSSLQTDQPRVFTFSLRTQYWSDSPHTVNGIVLTPGSAAKEFVSTYGSSDVLQTTKDKPLVYVVGSSFETTDYDSVSKVSEEANDGDLMSVEANLVGQRISVQESIEHSTPCKETVAQVQSPSGPICVDLLQDVVIDAGGAWTSVPESRDDVLFVVGASSQELDKPSSTLEGRYQITGEVVSTSRIDSDLPAGQVLVVYDMNRVGDIETAASGEAREIIDTKTSQLEENIQTQLVSDETKNEGSSGESSTGSSDESSSESSSETVNSQDKAKEDSSSDDPTSTENASEGVMSTVDRTISSISKSASEMIDSISSIFG